MSQQKQKNPFAIVTGALSITDTILNLIDKFSGDKDAIKIRKSIRWLKRHPKVTTELYVSVYFVEKTDEEKQNIINLLNNSR